MSTSQSRYHEIFEHTPVALMDEDYTALMAEFDAMRAGGITDLEGYLREHPEVVGPLASKVEIVDINRHAIQMYKAASKQELMISIDKTFDPESFSVFHDQLISLARGEKLFRAEAYSRTLLGERMHVFLQVRMLDDQHRGLLSMIDISQRKEMELALRDVNAALERSNVELKRSNRELEQFAYVVSHDLQEPVRMISSYGKLLTRRYGDGLDEHASKYLERIVDGSARLHGLITDLLAYARVGSDRGPLVPVSTATIVDRALSDMAPTITGAGASVTRGDLPVVMGNEVQLYQLFQNLVANGIKFRRADVPPEVHVFATSEGGRWTLAVRDNGIGIREESLKEIFSMFHREQPRGAYAGTGVGLAIVEKIAENHGGRVWVESTLGEGSTFYVTLDAPPAPA